MISVIVHEKIERREATVEIYAWALAILGLLIFLAGCIPGRRRPLPPADG